MTRWFKPWPSYPPNVGLVTELSSQRVTQLNHPKKVTFAELPGTHQHEFQLAHHFWGMVWIPSCFGTLGGVHLPGYKETSSSSTKFPQPNGYPFPPETPTPPNPIASSSFFNQKPKKEKKKHAFVVFFSVLDLAFRPKSPMLFTGPKSDPKNPKKNNGTEAVCGGALWWAWTKWTKSHSQPLTRFCVCVCVCVCGFFMQQIRRGFRWKKDVFVVNLYPQGLLTRHLFSPSSVKVGFERHSCCQFGKKRRDLTDRNPGIW